MKSYCLILFLLVFPFIMKAQNAFKIGFIGGVTTSQVHGDNFSGFNKAGFTAGGFAKRVLNDSWDVKFEIIYSEKGSRHNSRPEKNDYRFYLLRLRYAEVPIVVRYKPKKWVVELGMSPGFLVYYEEHDVSGKIPDPKPFNRVETNLVTGLAYQLKENIELNVRYTNSILPIRNFDTPIYYPNRFHNLFNRGMYNNVLSFTIHYQLKGKQDEQQ
jgi:hypothetical protein